LLHRGVREIEDAAEVGIGREHDYRWDASGQGGSLAADDPRYLIEFRQRGLAIFGRIEGGHPAAGGEARPMQRRSQAVEGPWTGKRWLSMEAMKRFVIHRAIQNSLERCAGKNREDRRQRIR